MPGTPSNRVRDARLRRHVKHAERRLRARHPGAQPEPQQAVTLHTAAARALDDASVVVWEESPEAPAAAWAAHRVAAHGDRAGAPEQALGDVARRRREPAGECGATRHSRRATTR